MSKLIATAFVGTVAALAMVMITTGCSRSMETATDHPAKAEEMDMKSETLSTSLPGKTPPIDAAAPTTVETATFGLG